MASTSPADTSTIGDVLSALPEGARVELNVPLDQLKQHPRNPRRGNIPTIRASIKEHGFLDVVVVQEGTAHILTGNHRVQAARLEGYTAAPVVIWTDMDDEAAERFMLAHNKSSDESDYDRTILLDVLRDLDQSIRGLDGTLYDADEIGELERITGQLGAAGLDFLKDADAGTAGSGPADADQSIQGSGVQTTLTMSFVFPDVPSRERVLRAIDTARAADATMADALYRIADDWLTEHGPDDPDQDE